MNQKSTINDKIVEEHGLTQNEYETIKNILGREPNLTELGIFSVMWSEHCSYKSSRIHLKEFPTDGPHVLQGPGENAGIIEIGDGLAVAFKMESHNHPSFIEPYQGAATGVGGIMRDIFTMGARPIANMNSLRFGDIDAPRMKYLVKGVVAGIGGYGNTMGVPTVGGEVCFNKSYNGNILVNAFTLGVIDAKNIYRGTAGGKGNPVIYVGSKTGRDGIHGATMASDEFDESSEDKKPTVQVGDPFTEKLLLEACLELMSKNIIVGIQDMGAAGLTCATFEMSDRGKCGMEIELDDVPKRAYEMTPYEIMLSESQERMLVVAQKGKEEEVKEIFDKWDLNCTVIGCIIDTEKVIVKNKGEIVAELPVAPVVRNAPVYDRPRKEPVWQKDIQKLDYNEIPIPKDLNKTLLTLISSPNLSSRAWVWEQYDHMVMTNTTVLPGSDAAVIRVKPYIHIGEEKTSEITVESNKGLLLTTDCNSKYCYLDPWMGAALAVAESARNISCTGGIPLAITDCLNFGNPEKSEIMWQFVSSVEGIAESCRQFETPVISGNVSFYNETKGNAIYPSPVIGMVGLIEDINNHCTPWWKDEGDIIILLGKNECEFGGSEYLEVIHNKISGTPPQLNFKLEKAVQKVCRVGILREFIKSAHDVSEGGITVCLAECSILRPNGLLGINVKLEDDLRADLLLFGESASRIIISVDKKNVDMMLKISKAEGANATVIGTVGGGLFNIENYISLDLSDLHTKWSSSLGKHLK